MTSEKTNNKEIFTIGNIIGIATLIATIIVGFVSIGANLWIYQHNAGKNRPIFEIKEVSVERTNPTSFEKINKELNTGKYAILNTYYGREWEGPTMCHYVLGKVVK